MDETSGSALVDWLSARLAENELVAREASAGPWTAVEAGSDVYVEQPAPAGGHLVAEIPNCPDHPGRRGWDADHIARHDPEQVLREIEATRRIVAMWRDLESERTVPAGAVDGRDPDEIEADVRAAQAVDVVVRTLAAAHDGWPGYRQEWAP